MEKQQSRNMKPRVNSFAALRMRKPLRSSPEVGVRVTFPQLPQQSSLTRSFPSARIVRPGLSPLYKKHARKTAITDVKMETLRLGLKSKSALQSPRRVEITQEIGHSHRLEVVKSDLTAQYYTSSRRRIPQRMKVVSPQTPKGEEEEAPIGAVGLTRGSGFYRTLPVGHNSIYYQEVPSAPARSVEKLAVHITARRLL